MILLGLVDDLLIVYVIIDIIKDKFWFILAKFGKVFITLLEGAFLIHIDDGLDVDQLVVYEHLNQKEELVVLF